MAEKKLQRKTPAAQRELQEKLNGLSDDDVISLFDGIGAYIKEHFTEIGGEGENQDGGSGSNSDGKTFVQRFFEGS